MTAATATRTIPTRRWQPWKIVLAAIAASFIAITAVVGITLALSWKELGKPYHADITAIDLALHQPFRPDAYLVVVVGVAQPEYMVAITQTF